MVPCAFRVNQKNSLWKCHIHVMYKLVHSVCVTLTLMNMSLNVLACSLSVCNVWNVLTVNSTLILVINCKFRHEANTGKIGYTNTYVL
jgi:hypothetical protein